MDRRTLSRIDEDLRSSEVAELCFLCHDVVPRKRLEGIKDATALFLRLEEKGVLHEVFLKELLHTISRADLLRVLETDSRPSVEVDASPVLSDYRKMLYHIYNDLTKENLEKLKFLLTDKVGKRQLEMCQTSLDVFTEMEKTALLSDTDVKLLHEVLQELDQNLAKIVQTYTMVPQVKQPTFPLDNQTSSEPFLSVSETQPSYVNLSIDEKLGPQPPSRPVESEYYSLTHVPRGFCVVFNNENFAGTDLRDRGGTQKDADALDTLFKRLGFEVVIHNDLTAAEMIEEINKLAGEDFVKHDALVVCVLSHGEKGCVFGTDGRKVFLKDLTFPFTSGSAPTLAGKPKLFFIQACQGDGYQKGFFPSHVRPREDTNKSQGGLEADAGPAYEEAVPSQADFLIGMATVEEYKSFRNTVSGSIYIQELCRQLMRSAESEERDDILSVLTRVNREVGKGEYLCYRQMPQPKYTLTKKLVLKYV